uniref:Uncharacterized protein n=1 Tax=Rhizophora mucronata TaxID=61149 RepID=A0A2P2PMS7_RHIMU
MYKSMDFVDPGASWSKNDWLLLFTYQSLRILSLCGFESS